MLKLGLVTLEKPARANQILKVSDSPSIQASLQ